MSDLTDRSITIYEAMKHIQDGKYVMPAFQREYVWNLRQIELLWDSILLDYPIATFLFWHIDNKNTNSDMYFCHFLKEATFDSAKRADSLNYVVTSVDMNTSDTAVLDGQQRLTSLFLSLYGNVFLREKHRRKKQKGGICTKLFIELDNNKIDVDEDESNCKKFGIVYSGKIGKKSPTQFDIKQLVEDERFQSDRLRDSVIEEYIENVSDNSKEYARNIIQKLYNKIFVEKLIRYTEIFGMDQNDALEMFVRFNSGGKALKKSEITMAILESYWSNSRSKFSSLLANSSYSGFSTDFVIRTSLMIFGDVTGSVNKKTAEALKNHWGEFEDAFQNLSKLLKSWNVNIERFEQHWNVLIPMIYVIYYNPNFMEDEEGLKLYLVRVLILNYFFNRTASLLSYLKNKINENNFRMNRNLLDSITALMVTEGKIDDVLMVEKNSKIANETLYFLSLPWLDYSVNYEVDHLHPDDMFDESYRTPDISLDKWNEWRNNKDRLPNLWFLQGRINASKSNMSLQEYYDGLTDREQADFRQKAMIPEDVSLEMRAFGEFYEKRKEILRKELKKLLN